MKGALDVMFDSLEALRERTRRLRKPLCQGVVDERHKVVRPFKIGMGSRSHHGTLEYRFVTSATIDVAEEAWGISGT